MRQRFRQFWQALTIKKKILMFTGAVFVTCMLSVVFNVWVIKFSLLDFGQILEQDSRSVELVQAFEKEIDAFPAYVQRKEMSAEEFYEIAEVTSEAVYALPFEYSDVGAVIYGQTWSIRNSYEVYVEKREVFLAAGKDNPNYINDLYEIYDIQGYLAKYASELMAETMEVSSARYQERVASLILIPWLILIVGIASIFAIIKLAQLMNSAIINPVMKLVTMSKRIADNEFFVEDVQVENQDELGELVHAFNKMKYATGEYITALEEKRKTLDLLHEEELEKLEMENKLESIKLDLLKSQVNPHFLFNTLNVIGGMANLEEAQTTEKMIQALSSLFRYNLKTDDMEVPLARELKVVEDYMYLQQMRFGERISYELRCEVDENRELVPAFTFQPLVENAIIHGLSNKEEGGMVWIRIRRRGKKLYIYIGDTGKGMSFRKLSNLKKKLHEQTAQEGHRGIGLGNIYSRVNAMYEGGRVGIYSKENIGTVIVVIIPQKGVK